MKPSRINTKKNHISAHYNQIAETKDKQKILKQTGKEDTLSFFAFLHFHFQVGTQKNCTMSSKVLSKNIEGSTLYNSQKLQAIRMIMNSTSDKIW